MTAHPIDLVIVDNTNVPKAADRSYEKARNRCSVADPTELNNTDFTGQNGGIYVRSLQGHFDLDAADTTTLGDGVTCIVDFAGNRFKAVDATGTVLLDFGAFPGATDKSVAVAAVGIKATTAVKAWILPAATSDHSVDEHWLDPPRVLAGNVVAGVGFTIYGIYDPRPGNSQVVFAYGKWNVAWEWQN